MANSKIGVSEIRGDPEGVVHFPVGSIIELGQAVVITHQGLLFSQVYGFHPDYVLTDSDQNFPDLVA